MDNDTSYESFLKYQEAGLKASNIPKKLWKEPFTKFREFIKLSHYTFLSLHFLITISAIFRGMTGIETFFHPILGNNAYGKIFQKMVWNFPKTGYNIEGFS